MRRLALLAFAFALVGCAPPGEALPSDAPAFAYAEELRADWDAREDLPPCGRTWRRLEVRVVPELEARAVAVRWRDVPIIFVRDAEPLEHVVRHEMAHLMASCSGIPDPEHELTVEIWHQPDGVVWAYEEPLNGID